MKQVFAVCVTIIRWCARIVSVVLTGFLLHFMIGEGPPPLHVLVPCLIVIAGFVLAWRYEALGGLLFLAGFIYFNVVEFRANGHLLRLGAFHLLLIPATLFLVAGCSKSGGYHIYFKKMGE